MGFFDFLTGQKPQGSAFTKIAQADDKVQQARGRIISINAANREKNAVADELEQDVAQVHSETDQVHGRLDNILEKL